MVKSHIKEMNKELKRIDKLGKVFVHFEYRKRFGWSFEKFIALHESGRLQEALGHGDSGSNRGLCDDHRRTSVLLHGG